MGELGLIGVTLPEEYGCANTSLRRLRPFVAREIRRRIDSGYPLDELGGSPRW